MKFDHMGVITATLAEGRREMIACLGIREWTQEFTDTVNQVHVQFGRDASGICYELLAPLHEQSPIANALRKRSNILNHVAYLVSDLAAEAERLQSAGAVPTGEPKPAIAYQNRRIQFFLTPLRFIVELIEAPEHQHVYVDSDADRNS